MTTPTAKQEYLQALQTKRDIERWLDLPRCTNCQNYSQTASHCPKFGPVPPDAAFAVHASPCPGYAFEDVPF